MFSLKGFGGGGTTIAYFFSSLEGRSLFYDLKRYGQKVTKIKCKEKDALISSREAPKLLQKKSYVFKKFVKKAEVVNGNITSGGILGQSP